jgi:hypothetical protein
VFTPAGPGPADTVRAAVHLVVTGGTVHLGRLLAAAGVSYIVLLNGLSPTAGALPTDVLAPAPVGLQRVLLDQNDLRVVPGQFGLSVFENAVVMPVTAQRSTALTTGPQLAFPGATDVVGWRPVLHSLAQHSTSGAVGAADLYAGYAPAGALSLHVDGKAVARRPAFGWAAQFPATPAGRATLQVDHVPFIPIGVVLDLVAWLVLAAALLDWRRWPRWPRRRVRAAVGKAT